MAIIQGRRLIAEIRYPFLLPRNIQFYVSAHNQEIRRSVGEPTDEEARKCLIEAGGDMTKAMDSCYEQRKKKVCVWAGEYEGEGDNCRHEIAVSCLQLIKWPCVASGARGLAWYVDERCVGQWLWRVCRDVGCVGMWV